MSHNLDARKPMARATHSSRWGGAVVLIALLVGGGLLVQSRVRDKQGLPLGTVSVVDVRAHAEARLLYPGAMITGESSNAQSGETLFGLHIGALVAAQSNITAQADAPRDAVERWYDQWLRDHGWRRVRHSELGGTLSDTFDRDGRERFVLSLQQWNAHGTLIKLHYRILPFGEHT